MAMSTIQKINMTLESLIAIFSIIGNGFILFMFAKEKKLRKRRNFYLMSLALSDFLLAFLGVPASILLQFSKFDSPTACLWQISILNTTKLLCIYSIVTISLDRLQACLVPIAYHNTTTKSSIIKNIIFYWFFAFMIGFLPVFGWNLNDEGSECRISIKLEPDFVRFFTIIGLIIPFIIIVITYAIIIGIIIRIRRNSERSDVNASSSERSLAQKLEITATLRISLIVVSYLFCEFPISVINIIGGVTNVDLVDSFLTLGNFHTTINPFLYAFHIKDFKEAFAKIWRRDSTLSEPLLN